MSDEIFKAFIGGLPYDALASDVEQILEFAEFSADDIKKVEIHLVHDRESGQFKGFGYVTFPNEEQVERFIAKVDSVEFAKRRLKVNRAQQRDRNDRGGRGGSRGGFGGDRGGRGGGGGGGFRRGGDHRGGHRGGDRFHDGGRGFGGGNRRQRKESEEFGGSQHEDAGNRPHRQSEEGEGPSAAPAAPAQRPRLNLKPRTTDSSEIEARKKQEEEETKKRQEKLFG